MIEDDPTFTQAPHRQGAPQRPGILATKTITSRVRTLGLIFEWVTLVFPGNSTRQIDITDTDLTAVADTVGVTKGDNSAQASPPLTSSSTPSTPSSRLHSLRQSRRGQTWFFEVQAFMSGATDHRSRTRTTRALVCGRRARGSTAATRTDSCSEACVAGAGPHGAGHVVVGGSYNENS